MRGVSRTSVLGRGSGAKAMAPSTVGTSLPGLSGSKSEGCTIPQSGLKGRNRILDSARNVRYRLQPLCAIPSARDGPLLGWVEVREAWARDVVNASPARGLGRPPLGLLFTPPHPAKPRGCPPVTLTGGLSGGSWRRWLVAPGGVEPPTHGLGNRCSIRLSYGATSGPLCWMTWT